MKKLQFDARTLFIAILAVIAVIGLIITPDYGVTGDEYSQYNYGEQVWKYLKTFGEDQTAVTGKLLENTQAYYGGLFDGFTAMIEDIFHPKDPYLVRHYFNLLFGLAALALCGLLAKEVWGGWRAAIFATLLLIFTPRFFGEMFNNPKDIPFAATYLLGLYATVRWLKNADNLTWRRTILLGLAIAAGLSIRIGGVLLIFYLGLAWLVEAIRHKRKYDVLKKQVGHLFVAVLIGYFGSVLWWPFAWEDPINNPIIALREFSDYRLSVKLLFEGKQVSSTDIPKYYAVKMLGITLPIVLWLLSIGGAILIVKKNIRSTRPYLWIALFAILFPIAYISLSGAVLYDGIRHLLFLLPPMAVLGGAALDYALSAFEQRKAFYWGTVAIVLVLLISPARFLVAAHPNQYVYFNEATGGLKGAYGQYETDYYMNSVKQGWDWLLKHEKAAMLSAKDTPLLRTNCVDPVWRAYYPVDRPRLKLDYGRYYQRSEKPWDYGLYYGRFLDRLQLKRGYFPGDRPLHVVEVDGVPLCVVQKADPKHSGFLGYTALKAGQSTNAVAYLKIATADYPKDMELWAALADASLVTGDTAGASLAVEKAAAISSLDVHFADRLGGLALSAKNEALAAKIFAAYQQEYPSEPTGYFGMAQISLSRQDGKGALAHINNLVEILQEKADALPEDASGERAAGLYQTLSQCYGAMAQISQMGGNAAGARQYGSRAQQYGGMAQAAIAPKD